MTSLPGRTVLVLCDAAETTGLGHFVRCTSLAAVLTARGADVRLLLPEDSAPRAVDRARAAGWPVRLGPWLPEEIAGSPGAGPVVIVDTYRVSGPWLTDLHRRLAASGGALAVVDDLADRDFEADLVLNQNVGTERLPYPGAARVLAGPAYALLRPEFAAHRAEAMALLEQLPDSPRSVLVLFGGTDATGMALTGASAAALAFPGADIRAVVPGAAQRAVPAGDGRITLLDHVDAIDQEMLAADLVLSAGGTTLWELCCLARPTAVVAVAGNQLPAYDEMSARGAILPAGREPVRDPEVLAARLRELLEPHGVLRAVAARAAAVTDGAGCARVADVLAELVVPRAPAASAVPPAPSGLRVRRATQDDAVLLHTWRNDPAVRSLSRSSDPIDLATHAAWLERSLADPGRHLLVVETTGAEPVPVATTRYDLLADGVPATARTRWEVSITVAPEMRGRGLGSATLQASDAWLRSAEPGTTEIVAFVRPSNTGSRRLFERNGYRATPSPEQDMDCFVRPWEGR